MDRCWLQGSLGDAVHTVCCAAGYNIRWLMRAVLRLGLRALLFVLVTLRRLQTLARDAPGCAGLVMQRSRAATSMA